MDAPPRGVLARAPAEAEEDDGLPPPPGTAWPAPSCMHNAVRPGIHQANVMSRISSRNKYVPDLGFDAYLTNLRAKPRGWLIEQVEGGSLVRNIEEAVVSENFVRALQKAYSEAKPRTPSPPRLLGS